MSGIAELRVPLQQLGGDTLIPVDPPWLIGPRDYDNNVLALTDRVRALRSFQSSTDKKMQIAYSYWIAKPVSRQDQFECHTEIQIIRTHLWKVIQTDEEKAAQEQGCRSRCFRILVGIVILVALVGMIVWRAKK